MSTQRKGFDSFIRPSAVSGTDMSVARDKQGHAPTGLGHSAAAVSLPHQHSERIRETTSTGRVRTYSASRQLPGITLRVTEDRWEKLKMMSIQERRPLQEIVSEAMELYMRERGLPW